MCADQPTHTPTNLTVQFLMLASRDPHASPAIESGLASSSWNKDRGILDVVLSDVTGTAAPSGWVSLGRILECGGYPLRKSGCGFFGEIGSDCDWKLKRDPLRIGSCGEGKFVEQEFCEGLKSQGVNLRFENPRVSALISNAVDVGFYPSHCKKGNEPEKMAHVDFGIDLFRFHQVQGIFDLNSNVQVSGVVLCYNVEVVTGLGPCLRLEFVRMDPGDFELVCSDFVFD